MRASGRLIGALGCLAFLSSVALAQTAPGSRAQRLLSLPPNDLVERVVRDGDAQRGALLFHQYQCTQCHAAYQGKALLGPNLTEFPKPPKRSELLESILDPSKTIRTGYQTVVIETKDGIVRSGILTVDTPKHIEFRDLSSGGQIKRFQKNTLEAWDLLPRSLMPDGLVEPLASDREFYDLAKYVIEVAEQGVERALELQPPQSLTELPPLPEYEAQVDHAGLISALDGESYKRGRQIYNRVCANCHGTLDRPGSLPTAPRFASSKLKNGSDPFRMYQTLTHGYGMMVAQRWMVPREKYDVIHFIQRDYLSKNDASRWEGISESYLANLPRGDTFGPEPTRIEPYITMDYGPVLTQTYEIKTNNDGESIGENLGRGPRSKNPWANPDRYFGHGAAPNFAYKGIAVRLNPGPGGITRGSSWMVFDHDTMNVQAGWSGRGFIDFCSIQFDGRHNVHPRLVGDIHFENPVGPGWAQPLTGTFDDPRPLGRDGRAYGPLPKAWLKYRGLYHDGVRAVLSYQVGSATVLELPTSVELDGGTVFVRQLSIGPAEHDLVLRVGPERLHAAVRSESEQVRLEKHDGETRLRITRRTEPVDLQLFFAGDAFQESDIQLSPYDFAQITSGSRTRWPEKITTNIETVHQELFAVDRLTLPKANPWNCQVRPTGHDFFSDANRAAVCTWDGDVWIVEGIGNDQGQLTWQRIASGLFQPLGLRIVNGEIYVTCRDQLVKLVDLNGDGETDFYACFNNDHQVTEHFHEFAMGLQTDDDGNFYYAKSARHAKRAVVPHHGTLLRVSADGQRTDIVATGFRAANGVCINPDGSFYVTDQEGHWNPKNRINRVVEGGFYGNMYGFTDVTDSSNDAMSQPLCWITNAFDRSPAELLWVPENAWGPLGGKLLNLSYGYGKIYVVTEQELAEGRYQGGMCALPIPNFPSGLVRGRFHPQRGDLFACSMFSWAGSQQQPGGFHRVRYDGAPVHLPLELEATKQTLQLKLSHPIDPEAAKDPSRYELRAWDLKRTPNYGSKHFNERELEVSAVTVSSDNQTLTLTVPSLAPTWGMSIRYRLKGADGRSFDGELHNSIFELPE